MMTITKRIISYTAFGIIAALIIAVVIMVCIPVNSAQSFAAPMNLFVYRYNTSYPNNTQRMDRDNDPASLYNNEFVGLVNKVNNAGRQNSLVAMFNGSLGDKAELKPASGAPSLSSNNTAGSLTVSSGTFKILYYYGSSAPTVNFNGTAITYKYMILAFNDADGIQTITAYLYVDAGRTCSCMYTYQADFSGVINYINSMAVSG